MKKIVVILGAIVLATSMAYVTYVATGKTIAHVRLLQERLCRIEYAIDASISGIHGRLDQLDSIEDKIYSYEDAMEAISLVLERNSGYYLYQELGVVVMSHDEYLRRGGN